MADDLKMVNDLERLKGQIRDSEKSLKESQKKAENLGAAIRAELRFRQHERNRRKK